MASKGQAGFTLVELSIVLVIVGLLVGGILKGQELIQNSRIARTLSQVDAFRGASATFQDRYNALPGDFPLAVARIPNVAAGTNGNGNGIIDGAGTAGEGLGFWNHLGAAGLIVGEFDGVTAAVGQGLPSASYGGGFNVLSAAIQGLTTNWIRVGKTDGSGATVNGAMTPDVAYRMDIKVDDGLPATGNVRTPVAACIAAPNYDFASTNEICTLAFKL